ncbi:hypothetical protein ED733_008966 [Metarhizium rileyi]|uniref:glutamate--tRNA ligase n=1 Tax=Metarhizium rileyi (strain RCEF 4871) TaxID=1649241 RepID=A0A5C6GQ96_METRR|nr:hypothetical protein ED733_008966 [Metarhizium rileyi]
MDNHRFLKIKTGLSIQDFKTLEPLLFEFNRFLTLRTFVGGYTLSQKDTTLWAVLCSNKVALGTYPEVQHAAQIRRDEGNPANSQASQIEGRGYLHIGSLILRFDDTNPKKEKQEYEDSIVEDLALLGIQCQRVTYTSDYFEQLYQLCQKLISDGNAYADDTDAEKQKKDRYNRLPSARRDRPAGESLAILAEMREGSDFGKQHCIRARIMFDIDSIEGVTHALRTTEYSDRNEQYYWFLKALAMRHVHLWDFARIHFIRTFLSKRKLSKVVDTGRVTGWDDPRMPTVRGIFRRGLQMDTLREFMLKQGPSRNVVTMDWTILWAMNKKAIDPVAPRHTAVVTQHSVLVTVIGGPDVPYSETRPKHPKNPAVGIKTVTFANEIFLDQADAALLQQDEEITIMSWGNAFVRRITKSDQGIVADLSIELHLEGSVTKANKKVHWLAAHGSNLVQAELWDFDHLLNKDVLEKGDDLERFLNPVTATTTDVMLDSNSAALSEGEVIQLERKGYYRVDKSIKSGATGKVVLFKIPTGTTRG